jgi:hypothetical protein
MRGGRLWVPFTCNKIAGMTVSDTTAPGGRPVRIAFGPLPLTFLILGVAFTAWPSGQVGTALAGLAGLWIGGVLAAQQSGPMVRFGGSFFLASAVWAALGFGFPGSFSRWPAAETSSVGRALPPATLTDDRYNGLVALTASVRSAGTQFVVTNQSTQAWQDITLAIVDADSIEYDFHVDQIAPGQSANAPAARFTSAKGGRYNPQRATPRTFIVTAEIGAGGPAGVYAVRL